MDTTEIDNIVATFESVFESTDTERIEVDVTIVFYKDRAEVTKAETKEIRMLSRVG